MRKYTELITLSVVLLLLIAVITLAMIFDVNLFLFNNLSIAGIQKKKLAVETLIQKQTLEELNNAGAKMDLQKSKNSFDVAKETYENIDDSTIAIVQEATKEENYFIEYLWVVLGNYASANSVGINIVTPGSTTVKEETDEESTTNNQNGGSTNATSTSDNQAVENQISANTLVGADDGIKITVKGRYANVADFVFDVENDKSLRFKLDNIKMTYSGDNTIQATFDVLSLSVLQ